MRPMDSSSNFAALAKRVERESSFLAHSSGSAGSNGVRGLVISDKDSVPEGGRKTSGGSGAGASAPSWTSSEASSFTVGLDQLAEKLRSRPSSSSGSFEEGRNKVRQRMQRKLRRSNSLPMPEPAVIPEISMSASSEEEN